MFLIKEERKRTSKGASLWRTTGIEPYECRNEEAEEKVTEDIARPA